jgi:hypothetical protein
MPGRQTDRRIQAHKDRQESIPGQTRPDKTKTVGTRTRLDHTPRPTPRPRSRLILKNN